MTDRHAALRQTAPASPASNGNLSMAQSAPPLITPSTAVRSLEMSKRELDERRIVGFHSRDARSRPYHLLRTQIAKIMARNNWRMIGVTSATPAAGKTFTSVNLAAAIAPTAQSTVVLCDLDLRRGSIAEMMHIVPEPGLTDYLEERIDDPLDTALRVNDTQLVVIPTIASGKSSSELIASPRFGSLMAGMRAMAPDTRIVCDLPPVFASDDTMLCMQYLDAYLLVVDHGISTASQVEEAVRLLDPVPCIGTVLNRYKGGFADPYGYGYGDTYGMKTYA
ncbi:CpsD/CapB family tyrosine-protein kinase [Sphingomonas sp. RS2018]